MTCKQLLVDFLTTFLFIHDHVAQISQTPPHLHNPQPFLQMTVVLCPSNAFSLHNISGRLKGD